jgi:hypothetical protein
MINLLNILHVSIQHLAIESAITNSIHLAKLLEPSTVTFEPKTGMTLAILIQTILIFVIFLALFLLYKTENNPLLVIGFIIVIASILVWLNFNL